MTNKACVICGDLLQRWEIGAHEDCSLRNGFVSSEDIDVHAMQDERVEREIERERMLASQSHRSTRGQKTVDELTDAEIERWAKEN